MKNLSESFRPFDNIPFKLGNSNGFLRFRNLLLFIDLNLSTLTSAFCGLMNYILEFVGDNNLDTLFPVSSFFNGFRIFFLTGKIKFYFFGYRSLYFFSYSFIIFFISLFWVVSTIISAAFVKFVSFIISYLFPCFLVVLKRVMSKPSNPVNL